MIAIPFPFDPPDVPERPWPDNPEPDDDDDDEEKVNQ